MDIDLNLLHRLFRAHPWHGVSIGDEAPERVTAYIEIVPTDTVKYELDKPTGLLKVDRPQKFSNVYPTLYGLIPQTLCGPRSAEYCMEKASRQGIVGDGDPLDICVLAEKTITHGDILLPVTPIGGLRMIDGNEADDKIIAVMRTDAIYGQLQDIYECPAPMIERLKHYFLTYKDAPGSKKKRATEITHVYGRDEAGEVIERCMADYAEAYGDLKGLFEALRTR
ncbi:MAG TPA: inorganic pyrophosphatase [Candidatus Krumholzibacteria bacterium]|nr:inorganic pyrophosphatase [Candidatus Krumholzibacteria bacterium]